MIKSTFLRDDVKVVVDGWTMPPFMGLGTWAAFKETNASAMVMGDTVLFEMKSMQCNPRDPRRVRSRLVPLTRYSAHKGRSKTAW